MDFIFQLSIAPFLQYSIISVYWSTSADQFINYICRKSDQADPCWALLFILLFDGCCFAAFLCRCLFFYLRLGCLLHWFFNSRAFIFLWFGSFVYFAPGRCSFTDLGFIDSFYSGPLFVWSEGFEQVELGVDNGKGN